MECHKASDIVDTLGVGVSSLLRQLVACCGALCEEELGKPL